MKGSDRTTKPPTGRTPIRLPPSPEDRVAYVKRIRARAALIRRYIARQRAKEREAGDKPTPE